MGDQTGPIPSNELATKLLNADDKTIRECIRMYGSIEVNIALLKNAVRQKMTIPKTRGYPPGIFISYRWENEKHKEWVIRLAKWLKSKGFRVFFDKFDIDLRPKEFYKVPVFISSIIECQYFLVILSPGYIERATRRTKEESWVTWEYGQALKLVEHMKIKVRAVMVSGNEWMSICDEHNSVDLREYSEDFDRLSKILPFDSLTHLDRQMNDALIEVLYHTDLFFKERNYENAYKTLEEYPGLSDLFEIKYRKMRLYAISKNFEKAREIALSIKDYHEIEINDAFIIIDVLMACQEYGHALKKLLQLKKAMNNRTTFNSKRKDRDYDITTSFFDTYPDFITKTMLENCYFRLGIALDKLASYEAAVQHYFVCRPLLSKHPPEHRSRLMSNIGATFLRQNDYGSAEKYLRKAIAFNPLNVDPYGRLIITLLAQSRVKGATIILKKAKEKFTGINNELSDFMPPVLKNTAVKTTGQKIIPALTYLCSKCPAKFRLNHLEKCICGDCATVRDRQTRYCAVCGNDGIVPLRYLEIKKPAFGITCPVCEKGTISKQ